MKLSYSYEARGTSGQVTKGHVTASSRALALAAIRRMGFRPQKVRLDLGQSLTAWQSNQFNPTELARLYVTLGRRLARGRQLAEGLEQAVEYVSDPRLRQAMVTFRQALESGQDESQAMLAAGFPRRDAMLVNATMQAGRTSEALISLGAEVKRNAALRKNVRSVFFMPIVMAVFMVLFLWGSLTYFAPITMEFLQNAGADKSLNPFLSAYFDFAKTFNANKIVASALYFGGFLALGLSFTTPSARRLFDRWPALRALSIKSDHATLWDSYRQMYNAAMPSSEAASLAASAAQRQDSRDSFRRLSSQLTAGATLEAGVAASGFPPFIVGGVRSAASSGDLSQGLQDLVDILGEDVDALAERFKESVRVVSVIVMGVGVLGVFMVTYYPILAATLANA